MARYRPIYIRIWDDDDEFLEYSDECKVLFFYLITNRNCTESGIYKISIKNISFLLNWKKEKFIKTLLKLSPNIYYDQNTSTVFVRNFYKYNGQTKGRPDLIEKSIINDMDLFTPLWSCFVETYPKFSQAFAKVLENNGKTILEYEYDSDSEYNYESSSVSSLKKGDGIAKWRTDYNTYLMGCQQAVNELLIDSDWINKQEGLNPGVDIALSLKKSYENYWGTEDGWKNKKSKHSDEIDWKMTFQRTLDKSKVYKSKTKTSTVDRMERLRNIELS